MREAHDRGCRQDGRTPQEEPPQVTVSHVTLATEVGLVSVNNLLCTFVAFVIVFNRLQCKLQYHLYNIICSFLSPIVPTN